jgi:uncharacterized protein YecE (DUF72 family)
MVAYGKGILIGTASWTDKTLVNSRRFYPTSARTAEARLRYYATQFSLVEIDSTYYAMPAPQNAALWVERTPPDFVFDVKAFRLFTAHPAQSSMLPPDLRSALGAVQKTNVYYRDLAEEIRLELWRRFRLALEPLARARKLSVVLLQFAPWFVFGRASFEYIVHCAEMLEGFQLAVEFRNKSWFGERTRHEVLAFEREHRLTHVAVDEPQGFANSIPQVWEVTCPDLAVVRLHGRNRDTWARKGLATSAERFNYLYTQTELEELAGPVTRLASDAQRVHVIFNNCHEDKAQRNGAQFGRLLQQMQLPH